MKIEDGRDGSDYVEINRANWDDRARAHDWEGGYDVQRFVDDPALISDVVEFDRPVLGDIAGLDAVHLQCHIGTDTLSLARLGARMTGLDLSPASIEIARRLAADAGADVRYVEADVYDAVDALGEESVDLVYTGVGALCWLPSIERWARTVAGLLRTGGRLVITDVHPVLLSIGDDHPERLEIGLPYFEMPEPDVWDEALSYVATERPLTATVSYQWNHGIGEMVTALLEHGMELTTLVEHRTVAWPALPELMEEDETTGEWRLREHPERLPLMFTLAARKR